MYNRRVIEWTKYRGVRKFQDVLAIEIWLENFLVTCWWNEERKGWYLNLYDVNAAGWTKIKSAYTIGRPTYT